MTEELLCKVQRPGRYLGNEVNLPRKQWAGCRLRVVLAFPDVYEVGMSHVGLLLLYEILNRIEWIGAERVFAPWPDMEASLRAQARPLVSLESATPLALFDVVGFSLQYELSYSNVLTMLELGGIPLLAAARRLEMPVVIGGGPCAFNPEPLADFFDVLVLGDGEELVLEIAEIVASWKSAKEERRALLRSLAKLEGVYVPEFFQPHYGSSGRLEGIVPRFPEKPRVRKRILPSLSQSQPAERPLVPCAQIVHDRLCLEVVRGCTRGCRFCQAGIIYRPVRERPVAEVLELVARSLASSGYEELSLLALSIGDYSCIQSLLASLVREHADRGLAISLPSLRVGTLDEEMIEAVGHLRKTGFTLAPEAGSDRLRRVINKGISESQLLATVDRVYSAGWQLIKVYFMMGLPTETAADRQAVVELCLKLWRLAARYKPARRLHVSISTFVPKAHTPFQWESQISPAEMENHLAYFKEHLRKKGLRFKWHNPWQSMLEGVFARGDRRLAPVLLQAQKLGCRFDGWSEQLRPDLWRRAFAHFGLDPSFYGERAREPDEILPWSHLDCGVKAEYLWREYQRALAQEETADCREQGCSDCGVCDHQVVRLELHPEAPPVTDRPIQGGGRIERSCSLRLRLAKTGRARFLSHLEMAAVIHRAMRRAGLPLAYSQGYHPNPKISFAEALPVGIESQAEEMQVKLSESVAVAELCRRVNAELPPGVKLDELPEPQPDVAWRGGRLVSYEASLKGRSWPCCGFERFQRGELPLLRQKRKRGEIRINLAERLASLEALDSGRIRFSLRQAGEPTIRVRDLLALLFDLPAEQLLEARIVKIASEALKG